MVVAGVGITFGLWWTYFIVPSGELLARHRERSFVWGYGQIVILGAIAAIGAGLHVAADVIDGHAAVGVTAAIVSVSVPALVFSVTLFALHTYLLRELDRVMVGLVAGCVATLRRRDRPRRRGSADRCVPGRRHDRAGGGRGRLRDRRVPPRGRSRRTRTGVARSARRAASERSDDLRERHARGGHQRCGDDDHGDDVGTEPQPVRTADVGPDGHRVAAATAAVALAPARRDRRPRQASRPSPRPHRSRIRPARRARAPARPP